MARVYTVTQMQVLPQLEGNTKVVIDLRFTYGDAEAMLNGSCPVPAPEGVLVPLESITQELAVKWLLEYCPNTTEEFDAQLDRELAEKKNPPFVYELTPEPMGATKS
jgi:hypothetical protein